MSRVVEGDFEWDSAKAESNLEKHGVSFPEAATVFADPMAVYLDDGTGTGNMVVIGTSLRERLLCVVHVERGQRDRITGERFGRCDMDDQRVRRWLRVRDTGE